MGALRHLRGLMTNVHSSCRVFQRLRPKRPGWSQPVSFGHPSPALRVPLETRATIRFDDTSCTVISRAFRNDGPSISWKWSLEERGKPFHYPFHHSSIDGTRVLACILIQVHFQIGIGRVYLSRALG